MPDWGPIIFRTNELYNAILKSSSLYRICLLCEGPFQHLLATCISCWIYYCQLSSCVFLGCLFLIFDYSILTSSLSLSFMNSRALLCGPHLGHWCEAPLRSSSNLFLMGRLLPVGLKPSLLGRCHDGFILSMVGSCSDGYILPCWWEGTRVGSNLTYPIVDRVAVQSSNLADRKSSLMGRYQGGFKPHYWESPMESIQTSLTRSDHWSLQTWHCQRGMSQNGFKPHRISEINARSVWV